MTRHTQRIWLDVAISTAVLVPLAFLAHWTVALVTGLYGAWCYYDGITRRELR